MIIAIMNDVVVVVRVRPLLLLLLLLLTSAHGLNREPGQSWIDDDVLRNQLTFEQRTPLG